MDDIMGKVLFDQQTLQRRVQELGRQITADYQDADCDELVMIGILRGSVPFMADLIRVIDLPVTIDFMAMSSYAHGTRTSGSVRILKDINDAITDKHVLVVEDIIDTGLTLKCLTELLEARKPRSLHICTLLDKPSRRLTEIPVRYRGFEIPDEFVVGYGLDFAGHYRHLPYVGVLKPEAYA
ncbi:MAG: hypoxanthine phosphoribosyltransferase [Bacillota bacterium]|nr:hypoxanthine phosphoribosyltransferase [Bacillota bacterium]